MQCVLTRIEIPVDVCEVVQGPIMAGGDWEHSLVAQCGLLKISFEVPVCGAREILDGHVSVAVD